MWPNNDELDMRRDYLHVQINALGKERDRIDALLKAAEDELEVVAKLTSMQIMREVRNNGLL